jgi:pyruvate ferredoxin oxidoreductase beta subunit
MEIVSSTYPQSAWGVPWIHVAFETAASVAAGIEAGVKALQRKGKYPDKGRITVLAIAGDGGTADIGIQALSGALERWHDFIYLCYDNEAYMNTGIQRSSQTPFGSWTTTSPAGAKSIGQKTWKKNMPAIAAAHGIPYVATACPSYPFDLFEKVRRAKEIVGPKYLHIFSPCPTGWRVEPNQTIQLGRMAVESGVFPLYEIENGVYRVTHKPQKLRPVSEYLKSQRRFSHLGDEDIAFIQKRVDEEYRKLLDMERATSGECAPAPDEAPEKAAKKGGRK